MDLPKDYLSDDENREVKEKVNSFSNEAEGINYLINQGIIGYDDKEGKYYRSKIKDISNEDIDLLIQLEKHKILKGIYKYLKLILLFLVGTGICLSFFQPIFLSVLLLVAIVYIAI